MKQGDVISSLFFKFVLMYTIMSVQANQDILKLNGTYQLLVGADDVYILGGNVQTIKENAENFDFG